MGWERGNDGGEGVGGAGTWCESVGSAWCFRRVRSWHSAMVHCGFEDVYMRMDDRDEHTGKHGYIHSVVSTFS